MDANEGPMNAALLQVVPSHADVVVSNSDGGSRASSVYVSPRPSPHPSPRASPQPSPHLPSRASPLIYKPGKALHSPLSQSYSDPAKNNHKPVCR